MISSSQNYHRVSRWLTHWLTLLACTYRHASCLSLYFTFFFFSFFFVLSHLISSSFLFLFYSSPFFIYLRNAKLHCIARHSSSLYCTVFRPEDGVRSPLQKRIRQGSHEVQSCRYSLLSTVARHQATHTCHRTPSTRVKGTTCSAVQ